MKVNELEKLLGIPRATIRFYEKEGLLNPSRGDNGYRDYSTKDIEIIKTIIVLRKMGMSVELIRQLLSGDASLKEAVTENISELQKKILELNGAVRLCNELIESNASMNNFDADAYLTRIGEAEEKGETFASIAGDLLDFEMDLFEGKNSDEEDSLPRAKRLKQWIITVGIAIVMTFVIWEIIIGKGKEFVLPGIAAYVCAGIIFAIIFFIDRKNKTAGKTAMNVVTIISLIFLIAVVLGVVILLLNSRLHFWF